MVHKKTLLTFLAVTAALQLGGCASTGAQQAWVHANKVPEPRGTKLVQPEPTLFAGNRKKALPKDTEKVVKPGKPWAVIDEANKTSAQNPDSFGYFNAIMTYDFTPGYLYQVYTAPLKITDIQLQPGETIEGKPACGDTVRWILGVGKSRKDGMVQQHIYIKPTKPGLHTTLIVTTNRRTYHIELHSYKDTFMAAVNWHYPHDEMRLAMTEEKTVVSHVDINKLNFGYDVEVKKGSRPIWMPVKVFDDGRKTFIQFPAEMLVREAPALFILSRKGKTQLVNYRVKDRFYVVDRLFERAELRLGEKSQNIVRIARR